MSTTTLTTFEAAVLAAVGEMTDMPADEPDAPAAILVTPFGDTTAADTVALTWHRVFGHVGTLAGLPWALTAPVRDLLYLDGVTVRVLYKDGQKASRHLALDALGLAQRVEMPAVRTSWQWPS